MNNSLNLSLHKEQLKVFRDPARVKAVNCGRSWGKTYLAIVSAIAFCISYQKPTDLASQNQICLIVCPTLKMAKTLFWIPLKAALENCPLVSSINNSDYRISFKGSRCDLVLRGADNAGERLRGLSVVFAICDEMATMHKDVWPLILKPALTRNRDWRALCISTPLGKANHWYDFCMNAMKFTDWSYYHYTALDNPFNSKREILKAREELPERVFEQEYAATFTLYPGMLMTEASKDKHLLPITLDPEEDYFIGIDPGVSNPGISLLSLSKELVFKVHKSFCKTEGETYTTDDIINATQSLIDYAGIQPNRIFIPDDRADLVKSFRAAGYRKAILVKRHNPSPIQRAVIGNSLFKLGRLIFSDKEEEFFDEMLSYRRQVDKSGTVLDAIEKGQLDHRIDSLLYAIGALCVRNPALLPTSLSNYALKLVKPESDNYPDLIAA